MVCWLILCITVAAASVVDHLTSGLTPDGSDGQTQRHRILSPNALIYNGQVVTNISKYPFMAALLMNKRSNFCGGSIISPDVVITAAHCLERGVKKYGYVYVGHIHIENLDNQYLFNIQSISLHPDVKFIHNDIPSHDVALIKLDRPIDFQKLQVAPVQIGGSKYHWQNCKTIGWGLIREDILTKTLHELTVTVQESRICKRAFPKYHSDTMMCVKGSGISGICGGDSGGPLLCPSSEADGHLVLVGITSFAYKSCNDLIALMPGYFTRLAPFRSWIDANMEQFNDTDYFFSERHFNSFDVAMVILSTIVMILFLIALWVSYKPEEDEITNSLSTTVSKSSSIGEAIPMKEIIKINKT